MASATVAAPAAAFHDDGSGDDEVIYLSARDPDFAARRQLFNQRFTQQPATIALPRSERGVASAVRRAAAEQLPIAIKSGGHCFEGFSLNDGGMTIDLALLNRLQLFDNHQLLAGPGCKLASVYDYCLAKGRLLPAGSCGGVGLAGLTLGGGYGLFARQFGLTCDHLIRLRMIDGNGDLHDSADEPELLWACRGGGNGHFGVVTAFTFRTQAAPAQLHNYRFRFRATSAAEAATLARWWFALVPALPAAAYSALVANGHTITVVVTSTLSAVNDGLLQPILSALSARASKVLPVVSKPLREAVKQFYGQKGPLPFKNVSAGFYREFADIEAVAPVLFDAVQKQRGLIYQINTFGPLPAAAASAFPHREALFIGELQAYWQTAAEAPALMRAVTTLQQQLWQADVQAHYANYPDVALPDWPRAYYGQAGYHRLQQLKQRYDPDNHFRHGQSVALPLAPTL